MSYTGIEAAIAPTTLQIAMDNIKMIKIRMLFETAFLFDVNFEVLARDY